MGDNYEPIPLFSPAAARWLWVIAVAVCGLSLALNLWGWARRGQDWTTLLGPLGVVVLVASYPLVRSRGRAYLVLQVVALGLLIASLVLTLRRW